MYTNFIIPAFQITSTNITQKTLVVKEGFEPPRAAIIVTTRIVFFYP